MEVIVPHEYEMFASPSFNIVRAVWMLLMEDKALKVWPISICVRGIERDLKHPPAVYSKLRVSSGRTHMLSMQLNCFFPQLIPAAHSPTFLIIRCCLLNSMHWAYLLGHVVLCSNENKWLTLAICFSDAFLIKNNVLLERRGKKLVLKCWFDWFEESLVIDSCEMRYANWYLHQLINVVDNNKIKKVEHPTSHLFTFSLIICI